jgi:hypothetical protein
MGANWQHNLNPEINPLYAEAQRLNVRLQVTSADDDPGDDVLLYMDSEQVRRAVYNDSVARYSWMKENFDNCYGANEVSRRTSVYTAFETLREASEKIFGACSEIEKRCTHWFYDRMPIDLAAPLCDISISSLLEGIWYERRRVR